MKEQNISASYSDKNAGVSETASKELTPDSSEVGVFSKEDEYFLLWQQYAEIQVLSS